MPTKLSIPKATPKSDHSPHLHEIPHLGPIDGCFESLSLHLRNAFSYVTEHIWKKEHRMNIHSSCFYVHKGKGHIIDHDKDTQTPFSSRQMLLVPGGLHHSMFPSKSTRLEMTSIHFDARCFGSLNFFDIMSFPLVIHDPQGDLEVFCELISREAYWQSCAWKNIMESNLRTMLLNLTRRVPIDVRTPKGQQRSQSLERLLPAFELIEKRFMDADLKVEDLAGSLKLNEVSFRELFKKHTGLTPIAYLQRRRVHQACHELNLGQDKVDSIAKACGFNSSQFFYRVFKKWMNTTPEIYRQRMRFSDE